MKKYTNQVVITVGFGTPTTPAPTIVVKEFTASTRSAASDAAWAWRTSEEGRATLNAVAAANVPQGTSYSVTCERV